MPKELKDCPKTMEVVIAAWRYDTVDVNEIAAILNKRPGTIRNHLAHLRQKIGVEKTRGGLHKADQLGLLNGYGLGEGLKHAFSDRP